MALPFVATWAHCGSWSVHLHTSRTRCRALLAVAKCPLTSNTFYNAFKVVLNWMFQIKFSFCNIHANLAETYWMSYCDFMISNRLQHWHQLAYIIYGPPGIRYSPWKPLIGTALVRHTIINLNSQSFPFDAITLIICLLWFLLQTNTYFFFAIEK